MVNQDQIKELHTRIQAISIYLKITEKKVQLQEAELKSQDPSFWDCSQSASHAFHGTRPMWRRAWVS